MRLDIYGGFAKYYDELMYDVDYKEWYDYIRDISENKYSKVLEMACGTGNLTKYIAEDPNVKSITCFDISEDMLIEANSKLDKYNNIEILRLDMINMSMSKKFDLVISACDSLNYILEKDDMKKIFKNVYNLLEDGGSFIFDMNSYYKLKEIIGNNIFVDENEKVYYIWENYFDEETDICEFYLTFFEKNDDGTYTRFDEVHDERAYKEKDIKNMLIESGFKDIKIYYDFKTEPSNFDIGIESNRVFFVCNKHLT